MSFIQLLSLEVYYYFLDFGNWEVLLPLYSSPWNTFCSASLAVMNCLSLCFPWNVFASISILKDSIARHRTLSRYWLSMHSWIWKLMMRNCILFHCSVLVIKLVFFSYSFLYCLFGLYCWHLDYIMRVTLSWWDLFQATTWEQGYLSLCIPQYITFQPIRIQTVFLSGLSLTGQIEASWPMGDPWSDVPRSSQFLAIDSPSIWHQTIALWMGFLFTADSPARGITASPTPRLVLGLWLLTFGG